MRRHPAFTLVEILVVIAIIGILVSLLLPAVQAAREAARRMNCQSNLKQLGLAMLQYHDVHRKFPRGAYPAMGMTGGWEAHGNGPITMLLPFVEQQPLYDKWDFSKGIGGPNAALAESAHIKLFLCPSDSTPSATAAWNNYCLSTGPNVCWTTDPKEAVGIIHLRVTRSLADVRDGTSNTILAAEIVKGDGDHGDQGGNYSVGDVMRGIPWGIKRIKPSVAELVAQDKQSRTSYAYAHHYGDIGRNWYQPHPYDSWFNTLAPPNPPYANCVDQFIMHDTDGAGLFPSRSRHPGGALHVFCDGSVHFIANSTEVQLYQNLGTINGGEVLGEF